MLSAVMAPACLTTASQTAFGVAKAAVWEAMARAPASVTPPFQTTTGFASQARRSASKKRRPSFTPSAYMAMTCVSGSAAR